MKRNQLKRQFVIRVTLYIIHIQHPGFINGFCLNNYNATKRREDSCQCRDHLVNTQYCVKFLSDPQVLYIFSSSGFLKGLQTAAVCQIERTGLKNKWQQV